MSKTLEQMAKGYVEQESLEYEEAAGGYYGFIAGYQAAQQWISVKERLPEDGQVVLTSCEQGKVFLLRKVSEEFLGGTLLWKYCCGYDKDLAEGESYCYEISHWMPLPKPPEAKE